MNLATAAQPKKKRNTGRRPPTALGMRMMDFCEYVGLSRTAFWKYAAENKIRTIRLGRGVIVPQAEVERIMQEGIR